MFRIQCPKVSCLGGDAEENQDIIITCENLLERVQAGTPAGGEAYFYPAAGDHPVVAGRHARLHEEPD